MCFARLLSPSLGLFGRLHHTPKPDTPPHPPPPPTHHHHHTHVLLTLHLAMRHSQPSLGVPRSPSTAPPCFSSSPKRSILPFFGRAAFTDMMPGYMHTQATSCPAPPLPRNPTPPPPPKKGGQRLAVRRSQPSLGVPHSSSSKAPSPQNGPFCRFYRSFYRHNVRLYAHTGSLLPRTPHRQKKGETGTHRASCSASFTTITWCTSLAIVHPQKLCRHSKSPSCRSERSERSERRVKRKNEGKVRGVT
jgi:hypothetical protein